MALLLIAVPIHYYTASGGVTVLLCVLTDNGAVWETDVTYNVMFDPFRRWRYPGGTN